MCNCCCGVDVNGKRQCRCRYCCVATFAILEVLAGMAILGFGIADIARNYATSVRFLMSPDIWAGAYVMMTGWFGMCNGCCHHRGLGVAFILMSLMGVLLIGASIAIPVFTGVVYTFSYGYTCTQSFQNYFYFTYACSKPSVNSTANIYVNLAVAGILAFVFILNIFGTCCGCCTSCRCCGADAEIVPHSVSQALRNAENGQAAPVTVQPTKTTPVNLSKESLHSNKSWRLKKNKIEAEPVAEPPVPEATVIPEEHVANGEAH